MRLFVLFFVVAGMIVAPLGCTNPPRKGIEVVTGVEQDDFPVPEAFELVASEVFKPETIDDQGFRSSISHYHGETPIGQIVPYYVREMPKHGWELQEIIGKRGEEEKTIVFYKGDSEATVKVYLDYNPKRGGYGTMIESRIGPRGLETFRNLEKHFGLDKKNVPDAAEPVPASASEGTLTEPGTTAPKGGEDGTSSP